MKIAFVAAACAVVSVFAAPAFAQATTSTAANFSLAIEKKPITSARSVEFTGTLPTAMMPGRAAAAAATTFSLKISIVRTADRTFDDWAAQSGAVRNVQVNFQDRAGKPSGGYELEKCAVADWHWNLDATSNALASETWTITCATARRL